MTAAPIPQRAQLVFLITLGFWYVGWLWKFYFLFVDIFLAGLFVELAHPLFPSFMTRGHTAMALYFAPLLGGLPLLRNLTGRKAILIAAILLLSSLGLLGHINSYNDATFTTCFWSALWLLWFALNCHRQDEALALEARWLAKLTVAVIFLGGAVGKLTSGYWSGEVLHTIYFEQKDYFLYSWLRDAASLETRQTLAMLLSRAAILGEATLALAVSLPYRWYARLGIITMLFIVAISTFYLFSVMAPLVGLLLANQLRLASTDPMARVEKSPPPRAPGGSRR